MELFESTRMICEARSNRFLTWLMVYWQDSDWYCPFPEDFTHLMMATWLGQRAVVEKLLGEEGDINARSEQYGTTLNIAALRKDEGITRMLLEIGVNAYLGEKEYNILHTKRSELERIASLDLLSNLNNLDNLLNLNLRNLDLLMNLRERRAVEFLVRQPLPPSSFSH